MAKPSAAMHGKRKGSLTMQDFKHDHCNQQKSKPDVKDMGISSQTEEPMSQLVQRETLICRDQDDHHQRDEDNAQTGIGALLRFILPTSDRAQSNNHEQTQKGDCRQLAKTAAGVFKVGQPSDPKIRLAAKEIFELHNDKGREENDHASQHNRSFSKTEELGDERFFFAEEFFILALQRGMKKNSSQDVCNEENITKTEDVFGKCIQIEKQLQERVELITEDRIRRSQQGRKDRKDRNCNHNAAQDGPKIEFFAGIPLSACSRLTSTLKSIGRAIILPISFKKP